MRPTGAEEKPSESRRWRTFSLWAVATAATAAGLGALYVLVAYTPLALLVWPTPDLPTEGIVATASGGEDMVGDDDVLVGRVRLESGCALVVPDHGEPVVPVFRSGAASVDGELSELRWKGVTYVEGARVELDGEAVGPISALPTEHEGYYLPGGCLPYDQAFLVNHFMD